MNRHWVKQLIKDLAAPGLNNPDIAGLQDRKQKHIPSRLFKIRGCTDFALDNLSHKTLCLSTANSFNDPYDTAFWANFRTVGATLLAKRLGLSSDETQAALNECDPLREIYYAWVETQQFPSDEDVEACIDYELDFHSKSEAKMIDLLVDRLKSTYKICSLTERLDSVVMWSHYGDNHRGFAMEYDFTALSPRCPLRLCLWPVAYTDQLFDITQILCAQNTPDVHFNNLFGISASLQKAKDWRYEKEWRLVIPDGDETRITNVRAPLKAVHLGAQISQKGQEKILEVCESTNTPVFKMTLASDEYKMLSSALGERARP